MLVIQDKIQLSNKKDVILIHLYIKSKELGVNISEGIRELLFYLHELGGIESKKDFDKLADLCNKHSTLKKKGTVRNVISMCVGLNIIKNVGKYKKILSTDWLPLESTEVIGLDYKIINAIQEGSSIQGN